MQVHTIQTPADIGALIKHTRKALNITQEELSLQTGISRPTIRSIEKGKETAHVGLVLQLCRDLGITIDAQSAADLI
ncbi:MAG: helix-turn-helix transcriptional regulator [Planktomarina sp.]